jgi:periplasmic protein TonB
VFSTAPPELIEIAPPTPPQPPKPIDDVEVVPHQQVTVVEPVLKIPVSEEVQEEAIYVPEPTKPGDFTVSGGVTEPPAPTVVEPRIDSRRGLSEPPYPASEIRQGHEGTVLLSLHILADGRVGEVKLARTSGFPKLDESAMREAKRWRFIPGTSCANIRGARARVLAEKSHCSSFSHPRGRN